MGSSVIIQKQTPTIYVIMHWILGTTNPSPEDSSVATPLLHVLVLLFREDEKCWKSCNCKDLLVQRIQGICFLCQLISALPSTTILTVTHCWLTTSEVVEGSTAPIRTIVTYFQNQHFRLLLLVNRVCE